MKKFWLFSALLFSASVLLSCTLNASPPPSPAIAPSPMPEIQYSVHSLPHSVVHLLIIPAQSQYSLTLAVAEAAKPVATVAKETRAIAALNAGFFDPVNQKTTSYVVQNGQLVADPRQNDRLINNPDLADYMNKILNRSEFRKYRCEQSWRYDITLHNAPVPAGCQLIDAVGAGPQLLPENTAEIEGFVDSATGRDALGSNSPNARTAIGLTSTGDIVWMMAAQKPDQPATSGMTFAEMIVFLRAQNVEKALNLDGGSSSSFYFQGKTIYGKVDRAGNPVQRSVKSILLVSPDSR